MDEPDEPLSIDEARARLSELVERAVAGELIEIRDGDSSVTLVPSGLYETLDILADDETREDIRAALKEDPADAVPLEEAFPKAKQPRSA